MISAAGATVEQHYGINGHIGRLTLALLTLLTVLLGLKRLASIVGSVAPAFIAFTMLIGLTSVLKNPQGIAASSQALTHLQMKGAYGHWFLSGLMYASFLMVGFMPFATGLGQQAKNRKDTFLGGLFAGMFFLAGAMILSTGLLVQITDVYNTQIPSLVIAANSMPVAATFFALLMLTGIYTASVSMLWTAVNRIEGNHSTPRYRYTAVLMTLLALLGGQLQFSTMVALVYPAVGYLGLVLIAGMIYTKIRNK